MRAKITLFPLGCSQAPSELLELLGSSGLKHVEAHCLAQGPVLAHCDKVADLDALEQGGQVRGHVLVALLKTIVFANDSGLLHLHLGHHTRQDPPLDGDVASKGGFSVGSLAVLKPRSTFL